MAAPTTDTIAGRLAYANELAQLAFHEMLVNKTFSDPDATETLLYVAAERAVDELLVDAQWEKAKAELDRLQSIDADFEGDHHVYPAGVGR